MTLSAFLHPFARPASERFITIASGEGAIVTDDQGRRYVDAMASLWYCTVGHGRAEIADAVAAQLRRLDAFHTFELFTNEPAERLCALLHELAPAPDVRVFLVSSGSEAVDSALKLARLAHHRAGRPERQLVVSRRPSYHGVTYGGMALTGLPANQEGFGPSVGAVVQVPKDDLRAVERVFAERGEQVAAVIAEPVIGAAGVYPAPDGYLPALRGLCNEYGAFLILDEVITGFGRLGTWWGAQHYSVTPDLVTFAKAVTSGYLPLGGVLVGPAVRGPLEADPQFILRHGHTYSGHPTSCAAGLAVLDILRIEGLIDRAPKVGERLSAGLRSVADGSDKVVEVRGEGAVWAVGLAPGVAASAVRDAMLDRGVIVRPIGDETLAFCPPLVIEDADVDRCVEALDAALTAVNLG
ncbi:MAG: aspartate aminotransferase family protein [Egibacteraceae bacterium]